MRNNEDALRHAITALRYIAESNRALMESVSNSLHDIRGIIEDPDDWQRWPWLEDRERSYDKYSPDRSIGFEERVARLHISSEEKKYILAGTAKGLRYCFGCHSFMCGSSDWSKDYEAEVSKKLAEARAESGY